MNVYPTLATDLDGTLIPLNDSEHFTHALERIRSFQKDKGLFLIFVTGRHLESMLEAVEHYKLPAPDRIVCDVGTTLYDAQENTWVVNDAYHTQLASLVKNHTRQDVEKTLASIDTLRLQEPEKQGDFKISYYCEADHLSQVAARTQQTLANASLPYKVLESIDPFTNDGLIDVLPRGVDKAYALQWLLRSGEIQAEQLVYAGDSGNDLPVFESELRCIIVGNTAPALKEHLQKTCADKLERKALYFAQAEATSGVVEGCEHFLT